MPISFYTCRVESEDALHRRLGRLALSHLVSCVFNSEYTGGVQQQAYLGNNADLLEHMRSNGLKTMTTKRVRTWLKKNGGFPEGYKSAHLCLDECDIDHILPTTVGGQDHPYNYVLLPTRLNGSLNQWWTAEKQLYLGRQTARTAKNFFIWVREEGARLGLDCNNFHEQRYSM